MPTLFDRNDVSTNKKFSHFRDVVETFYIPIGLKCREHTDHLRTHSTVPRSAQFQRARVYIDEHLANPHFTLDAVAAALGVSSRYVSQLLAEGGCAYGVEHRGIDSIAEGPQFRQI